MSENEVYLIPRDLDWSWGGVPVTIGRAENVGLVRFDDIRVGDVVTYERGEEGQPGYMRAVSRVVEPDEGGRPGNTTRGWLYAKQQKGYLRILSIDRPKPD